KVTSVAVVGGGLLFFTAWETIAPLRRMLEPKLRHVIRNLTVGGISLAILTLLQAPVLVPVAQWAMRHRVGLLNRVAIRAPFDSILFHHSNARLPLAFERVLVRFIVTPRMHGIHHSDRLNETNSNWSSLLSVWDYIHGTMVLNVPQPEITIGVPAYQHPAEVTIGKVLLLPFKRQRRDFH